MLFRSAVGLQSASLTALPAFKRELQLNELQAARDAGVDALVTVYHSEQRELCAHERDWPFRIINILELVGESMGLHRQDRYKELKIMQDAEAIVADCRDLIARGVIDEGMIPKVEACLESLRAGVGKTHIIDGRVKHSLLLEIFTDKGIGTEIVL